MFCHLYNLGLISVTAALSVQVKVFRSAGTFCSSLGFILPWTHRLILSLIRNTLIAKGQMYSKFILMTCAQKLFYSQQDQFIHPYVVKKSVTQSEITRQPKAWPIQIFVSWKNGHASSITEVFYITHVESLVLIHYQGWIVEQANSGQRQQGQRRHAEQQWDTERLQRHKKEIKD